MGGKIIFKFLISCFLEIIYPTEGKCIFCRVEENENFLCINCEEKISYLNNKFYLDNYPCYSVAYYNDFMKKLIYDYKYKKDFKIGEFFSLLMIEKIKKENLEFDYITFIPTNKITLEKRGFNQCEYLAKKIAEEFNKEVIEILEKRADAKEQKKLLPSERAKNVRRAYYVKNKELELDNKRLLIIDDVMTTGETLKSSVEKIKKYYNIEAFLLTVVKSSI